ncbi:MAG: polyketide cyclase [Propionibacteriales bacterium]|nr:polyketide cyclase [Propionibacteriales bacterium]
MNPDLDLEIERIIRAPREAVWKAWTDPASLEQWWVPEPARCRVERLEVRAGGAFLTRISDDGMDYLPHLDACFVRVEQGERIVFTNALDHEWRPAKPDPVAMTADITLSDHAYGTAYRVVVRHGDPAARSRHEELGFSAGWGSTIEQLARLVEDVAVR